MTEGDDIEESRRAVVAGATQEIAQLGLHIEACRRMQAELQESLTLMDGGYTRRRSCRVVAPAT